MKLIKSYTDIEQSKKLAEILPIEIADMYYWCADHYPKENWIIEVGEPDDDYYEYICAWSLAALLNVLPNCHVQTRDDGIAVLCSCDGKFYIVSANNPIDACYEMILKLHDLKML